MIRAGRLREKIVIQRPDRQYNDTGNWDTVPINIIETFCDVQMRNASNDIIAAHNEIIQPYYFTFRHRPDKAIRKGDILFWRERKFKIHSFSWDVLRTKLTIIAYTDTRDTLTDWDNINTENQQQNVLDEPVITEDEDNIIEQRGPDYNG